MKEQALKVLLRYIDNTKEANDALSELLVIFNVSGSLPLTDEIHNEFYTAGGHILQEATCLLKELEQRDLTKGKRLAAAGFGKTREAVVAIETETKLATTKEVAELVMYYSLNYPNNKFITEEQVKAICEKYGLIFGDTSMYKGFVPENKLPLIESFKLKEKEQSKIWFEITETYNGDDIKLPLSFISDKDLSERGLEYFFGGNCNLNYFYIKGSSGNSDLCKAEICKLFDGLQFVKAEIVSKQLKIVAPAKDMEIPQWKQLVGYKIKDIPDPVVLQPVKGGYLIVCAWGDEASDEMVVNQKMN
jgi:hypothetical protein